MVRCASARPLAALVLLSATLLARGAWEAAMPARRALPVFQSHGRQDPLLPFAAAVTLRDLWREGGAAVDWIEFNGGHEIPYGVTERLGRFLDAHLV
jgi:phospholipase/carboxylesterase